MLTCEQHPNADKLKVTTVDINTGTPLHIVCGAPNVAAEQKVAVATIGTTIHLSNGDSFKIAKSKLRGEVSEGMLCAEDELGLEKAMPELWYCRKIMKLENLYPIILR